eukprot:TRINITY_DN2796_c2_g3_i1.p1 TRINITY_DN2796_c2_g3~~TRINITY_DN2796_c2_g3_i1.p1  ORF type:complete len:279 (+),score=30.29 TRINITY_DN2796_c2_g3_i1:80-916(+)
MDHGHTPADRLRSASPLSPGSGEYYKNMPPADSQSPGDPGFFLPVWWLEERQAIPMTCMAWWGVAILITLLNYLIWQKTDEAEAAYGEDLPRAYIAFIILGMIVYFVIAATLWFWASRYSTTPSDRKNKTLWGIVAMWILRDIPFWIMDYVAVEKNNDEAIQQISFVISTLSFLVGGVVVWVTYTYRMTSYLNRMYTPPARHESHFAHTGSVFAERGGGIPSAPQGTAPLAMTLPPPAKSNHVPSFASPMQQQQQLSPSHPSPAPIITGNYGGTEWDV